MSQTNGPEVRWYRRDLAHVPAGDEWLTPEERAVLARWHVPKRRADWRLGRFTAKSAVAAELGLDLGAVAVLAAPDGAPEAFVAGAPAGVALSLTHRGGHAAAAVAHGPVALGIDLEVIEPRSDAFVEEWYAPPEQRLLRAADAASRPLVANAVWTAKEAAAKVEREGLRLDVRQVVVSLDPTPAEGVWRPMAVALAERRITGWWRHDGDLVVSVASVPPAGPPREGSAPGQRHQGVDR